MTNQTIQSIPTRYSGYHFRSRLEARWAVFFEALGIEAWYEPEAYKLKSGATYLPDFFLPKVRYYAEVKPRTGDVSSSVMDKPSELVRDSGRPVLMLFGPPDFTTYMGLYPPGDLAIETILDIDWHGRRHYIQGHLFTVAPGEFSGEDIFTPEYRSAVYASRSERFGVHE